MCLLGYTPLHLAGILVYYLVALLYDFVNITFRRYPLIALLHTNAVAHRIANALKIFGSCIVEIQSGNIHMPQ